MNRSVLILLGAAFTLMPLAGCGQSAATPKSAPVNMAYQLDKEPAGALEVLDARDVAKDGEPIVVVGRLGGGLKPWIDGRAAFLLVDTRILPSCKEGDKCEAGCPDCSKEMLAASTMVKFLGPDGKVIPVDARDLLGVKEQETLVVRGVANRDQAGNVSIAAEKVFVRR